MFKRGNWAVIGIKPSTRPEFSEALGNPVTLLGLSQYAAAVTSKFHQQDTMGINAFETPRQDEESLDVETVPEILANTLDAYLQSSDEDKELQPIDPSVFSKVVNLSPADFSLQSSSNTYAFWAVFNTWGDVTDTASKKEGLSYELMGKPYAFLSSDDKKTVDFKVANLNTVQRRQYPVILDFDNGFAYMETTSKREIEQIQYLLTKLQVEYFSLHWEFGESDWFQRVLEYVTINTRYKDAFKKRAEEMTRFSKEEIEKLEDKALEKIVTTYFALTELPSGLWAGLLAPSVVKLHDSSEPITVQSVTNATTLLDVSNDAFVAAAAIIIQDLLTSTSKDGKEKIFRQDLVRFELNENSINNLDVGAALLKGLDLPQFKKDLLFRIKKDKVSFSIPYFWNEWLSNMRTAITTITSSVVDILELPAGAYGLQPFESKLDEETAST